MHFRETHGLYSDDLSGNAMLIAKVILFLIVYYCQPESLGHYFTKHSKVLSDSSFGNLFGFVFIVLLFNIGNLNVIDKQNIKWVFVPFFIDTGKHLFYCKPRFFCSPIL